MSGNNEPHPGGSPRKTQHSTFNGSSSIQTADNGAENENAHSYHDNQGGKSSTSYISGFFSSIFGYRKTTLTLFAFITLVSTFLAFWLDSSLDFTVSLPVDKLEDKVLQNAWLDLQNIGRYEHPYASTGNDYVYNYLKTKILSNIKHKKAYIELDYDSNFTNTILYSYTKSGVAYYESNNLLVRINGTNPKLPALLVSAHYDSVPTAFGITDDGMGIASMLGLVDYYSSSSVAQPARTIVFNFNNDEEFGLSGATSFVLSHPWYKQVKYFLNLEGTGAGGKCVLFRGTDYGITKFFKNVRYPFGTSLFQQGFNNRLIHSETDYKVYKEQGGLRGIDLAFYKPRDLYHTSGDSIKNVNIKSLWHMLSNSLDFVAAVTAGKIDLDDEGEDKEDVQLEFEQQLSSSQSSLDFPSFGSLFNYFIVFPTSTLVIFNIVLLVAVPLLSLPLLIVVFYYKQNWSISFINFIKFPLSFGVSIFGLQLFIKFASSLNEFLPNSNYSLLVTTSFAIFALLNYLVLNTYNYIFYYYKVHDHDEKLIIILQVSFLYWIALLVSTIKLAYNKIGDDHTGEYPLTGLFVLQALGGLIGILGWAFKSGGKKRKNYRYEFVHEEENRPLIDSGSSSSATANNNNNNNNNNTGSGGNNYGSNEHQTDIVPPSSSSSFSLTSSILDQDEDTIRENRHKKQKSNSYGWSIQFLVIVPISSFIIFNSGTLILDGLNKSIQESFNSETIIYDFIQVLVVVWTLPFLAFIFKINKFGVLLIALIILQGVARIYTTAPFDQENPLKLRFIQSIDLDKSSKGSIVEVNGRIDTPIRSVLNDLPSLKEAGESVLCTSIGDGMEQCSFNTTLSPNLIPDAKSFNDYVTVEALKNSSNGNVPFGLLYGEIKISAPKNRLCNLHFHLDEAAGETPVKTVIVFQDKKSNASTTTSTKEFEQMTGIPKGFSRDSDGNFIYKDLDGIKDLQLNKLDWDSDYHIGFQWVPNFVEFSDEVGMAKVNKLGVDVKCFWGDLDHTSNKKGSVFETIPVYHELLHYSPNYVSWSNKDRGLVSVSKSVHV